MGGLPITVGAHLGQQGERVVERAGLVLGPRRRQRALRTAPRLEGQGGRALQERGGGRQAAPRLGPAGRLRQVGGDALVGAGRRLGQVPCAPVGIDLGVGRAGQRPVRPPPFLRRCRSVDRGARERMAKAHPGTDLHQASRLHCVRRHTRDRQLLGCAPHQRRITGGIGRRHDQEPPGVLRQRAEPLREALLDPTGHGHSARQGKAAGQLRRRELPGQLQQRQRIAPRLAQELVGHALVQPPGDRRGQKGARIGILQSLDHQLRHARELVARFPRDEQHHHRLGEQPPRHEHQRLRRGPVQPLRIVDHAQQRPILRNLGEQAQGRQADQQPIRHRAGTQPERGGEGIALRTGDPIEPVEHRPAQLVQGAEGQLPLGLHSHRAKQGHVRRRSDHVLQERGLADPRLAPHEQRATASGSRVLEQPIDDRGFVSPIAQHQRWAIVRATPRRDHLRPVRGLRERAPPAE